MVNEVVRGDGGLAMENGNILFRVKGANGGSENQGRWKREEREREREIRREKHFQA